MYSQPGAVGLFTTCCASRRPVFADPNHADIAIREIGRVHGDTWQILGYCVMPDHIHLLALNVDGSFLELMRVLKGRISRELRGKIKGALWQRSFHDHLLRRDEDISKTLRYMFENPVRAGLAEQWIDYRWCGSYRWPNIGPEFFALNPKDVMWNQVFECERGRG